MLDCADDDDSFCAALDIAPRLRTVFIWTNSKSVAPLSRDVFICFNMKISPAAMYWKVNTLTPMRISSKGKEVDSLKFFWSQFTQSLHYWNSIAYLSFLLKKMSDIFILVHATIEYINLYIFYILQFHIFQNYLKKTAIFYLRKLQSTLDFCQAATFYRRQNERGMWAATLPHFSLMSINFSITTLLHI